MVDEIIIGSHEKALNKYGQNGSDTPSSIAPGEKIERSAFAESILKSNPVTAGAGDQTRQLKGGNVNPDNVPMHSASRSRNGEGGTVPKSTNHKK